MSKHYYIADSTQPRGIVEVSESEFWAVVDEEHAGTASDPIPYDGNMALVNGLYYTQDGVVYKCTRDTGTPVYAPLRDLVGLYVEEVTA